MHALFFEVRPKPGHLVHYFDHVARLRPALARHSGLVFLDRYGALSDPDLLLSHQLWDSEAAIIGWRKDALHRRSQAAGMQVHFADYRIRVGARVLHWNSDDSRADASPACWVDAGPAAGAFVVALYGGAPATAPGFTDFESVNAKGKFIALASAADSAEAAALLERATGAGGPDEAAVYAIRRDYGLHDRAQAPGAA